MDEALQSLVGDLLSEQGAQHKSTEVTKTVAPKVDLGLLSLQDLDPVTIADEPGKLEERLRSQARDNCQLLINKVWELPTLRVQKELCVKLPPSVSRLPREKPIPPKKAPTKWEEYAKAKGIKKTKTKGKVWDAATETWKPRYGYKRANDDTKDWAIEVPQNKDPNTDMFTERKEAKKERIAKNSVQRLKNIARAQKATETAVPIGVGGIDPKLKTGEQLSHEISRARKSTASVGKFTERVSRNEKEPKNRGKKRKFEPNEVRAVDEKAKGLKILEKLGKATPVLNLSRAVAKAQARQPAEPTKKGKNREKKGGKRSAAGVHRRNRPAQDGKSAKGRKAGKKGRK